MKAHRMALPSFAPAEVESILDDIREVLEGRAMLSMHKQVAAFEEEFAKYVGCRYAIATNSCSAALEIALRSIGLEPGDEVILPAETFVATGTSILREGGRVVFAEVDSMSFGLSLKSVQEKLSSKTKAVILVHLAGYISPEVEEIKEFCDQNNIVLIEDAAHAHGATIHSRKAGALGHIGCFSFFPTKIMTTGEGGMLVTNDKRIAMLANSYRNRGQDMEAGGEIYVRLGTNNRMTEIAAIMGRSQLRELESFVERRNLVAKVYNNRIKHSSVADLVQLPESPDHIRHSYWRYMLVFHRRLDRVALQKRLGEDGISSDWAYYPSLHLQPVMQDLAGLKAGQLPETEDLLERNFCLPVHPGLTEEDADFIAGKFVEHLESMVADEQ